MRYYIGKWKLENGVYSPPDGMSAGLDLRSIEDMSNEKQDGYGLFFGNSILGSDYDLLGNGDVRDIKATNRLRNIFRTLVGHRPKGDSLSDLIFDVLTDGSDPRGEEGVRTLVPTGTSRLLCNLHQHGTIKSEKFSRNHPNWNKVRDVLRETYRITKNASRGDEHRKLLTRFGIKFGISDPQNHFIPKDLPIELPLPPSTTFTESFPSNGATLNGGSQDLTWDTDVSSTFTVTGNQLALSTSNEGFDDYLEAEHDLSDDDMSTSVDIVALVGFSGGNNSREEFVATTVRSDNSVDKNFYAFHKAKRKDGTEVFEVYKYVNDTKTMIVTSTTMVGTLIGVSKLEIVGSTLTYVGEGSSTDTSIVGNVRGGLVLGTDFPGSISVNDIIVDDVIITDGVSDPAPEPARDIPLQTTTGCFSMSPFEGSQSISMPFEPKVLMFYSNRNMENSGEFSLGISEANANLSMGWALGSGAGEFGVFPQCAVSQFTAHNRDDRSLTGSCRSHTPSGCFIMAGEDNTNNPGTDTFGNIASAYLTQIGTTTKIQWDKVDGIPREICYFAIGGDELNQFSIKQVAVPGSSGVVDYTGLGFQPGLLMSLSAGINDSGRVVPEIDSAMGMGWAVGSGLGKQYAHGHWCSHVGQDNFPTNHSHGNQSNKHLVAFNNDHPNDADPVTDIFEISAAHSGVHSDGFKLDWDGVQGSGASVFVLALEGNLYDVGTFTSPTVNSIAYPVFSEQTVEGIGFRPLSVFITGHGKDGFTNRGGTSGSFHSFSISNEDIDFDVRDAPTTHIMQQTVGLFSPNVAMTRFEKGNLAIDTRRSETTSESIRTATLDAFTNDGLELTWELQNGVNADYGYLAFGSKFSIGDMDYAITGALASGVAQEQNMIIDANNFPQDFPFVIEGGVNESVNYYITGISNASGDLGFHTVARTAENSGLPLIVPGLVGNNDVFTMFVNGPVLTPTVEEDGRMNMVIKVNERVADSGGFDIFAWSTVNPGLRDFMGMSLKNTNVGPFASMNMFVPNVDTGEVTSNMNMFVKSGQNADGSTDDGNNITFMIGASGTVDNTTMFVQGLGGADGSTPYTDSMNMVIYSNMSTGDTQFFMPGPSGENNNLPFHMAGQTSNSGIPFFMDSIDSKTGSQTIFTRGF